MIIVNGPPAALMQVHGSMQVFHQIPGTEASDLFQGLAAINNSGTAGKSGIVVVFAGLHNIVKNFIRIPKWVAYGDSKILFGLDKGD
jgi:hypothetical protein